MHPLGVCSAWQDCDAVLSMAVVANCCFHMIRQGVMDSLSTVGGCKRFWRWEREEGWLPPPHMVDWMNFSALRYCEMYSNIILNGSRRFVVTLVQPQPQNPDKPDTLGNKLKSLKSSPKSIAEVGVVFYVEEFNKVDEVLTGGWGGVEWELGTCVCLGRP